MNFCDEFLQWIESQPIFIDERNVTMEKIKVKYLRDIKPICTENNGDWIDLRAGKRVDLVPNNFYLIPLGVAMELPLGYEAIVAPRSSSYKKWGFIQTNSIGIIDESYCGDNDEWMLPIFATKAATIYQNDRICQFRIIRHQPAVKLVDCDTFGNADRGGFGSTGVK